jgi:hypothetical protein
MRQNFINRQYDIHILVGKNTNPKNLHADALIPQVAKKLGTGQIVPGKFYQLALYKRKTNDTEFKGGRAIKFNIFDTGIREGLFQDFTEALADPTKYTKLTNGTIVLNKAASGNTITENTGFKYKITFPDGRETESDLIRLFIFESEAEGDDDQALIASELRRARASIIQAPVDGGGTAQMEQ